MLGHLTLWGLKEPVMPWCTDGPDEAELGRAGGDDGLLGGRLPRSGWHRDYSAFTEPQLRTRSADATGAAAVEMINHGNYEHLEYYRYLNCGYRLPLVGGTTKCTATCLSGCIARMRKSRTMRSSRMRLVPGGAGRAYVPERGADDSLERERREPRDTLQLRAGWHVGSRGHRRIYFSFAQPGDPAAGTRRRRDGGRYRRAALHLKTSLKWIATPGWRPAVVDQTPLLHHHDEWQRGMFAHVADLHRGRR